MVDLKAIQARSLEMAEYFVAFVKRTWLALFCVEERLELYDIKGLSMTYVLYAA